jgi:SAM-dependent methyltransferase
MRTREKPPRTFVVRDRDALTKGFYESNATAYAEATWKLSMDEQLSDFATRLAPGAAVIDLGCGAGRDLKALSERGFFAVGLDVSAQLARIARLHSDCPVVVADLRHLPIAPERFDGAWASASLLHLERNDIGQALAEIRRTLKPGGLFFASMKAGRGEQSDAQGRWFSYYELDEWRSLLEAYGLASVSLKASVQRAVSIAHVPTTWINSISRRMQ